MTSKNISTIKGKELITFAVKKSQRKQTVSKPLHPLAKKIILKHGGKFPSSISNQKYNKYLKEMAKDVGFDQEYSITDDFGGKPKVKTKWELTTSHTARRNLVTNALNSGMAESDVMLLSGHKTLSAFRLYQKSTPEENAVRIAEASFFQPLKVAY